MRDITHIVCRILGQRLAGLMCVYVLLAGATVIWAAERAQALEQFTAHGGPVKDLTLSADGRFMVSASFDYSAVLWDAAEMRQLTRLDGHAAAVNTARFSADGRYLASGGDDHQILLWDLAAFTPDGPAPVPVVIQAHKGKIVHLAFSDDSRFLAAASWDGSASVWSLSDIEAGRSVPVHRLQGHDGPVNAVAFSQDAQFLYSAGYDGDIRYWRLSDASYLRAVVRYGWGVNVMLVDEAADLLAYGTTDGAMIVSQLSNGDELVKIGDERAPVLSVSRSVDKQQIVFGNAKGQIKVIDIASLTLLRDFKAANGPIWSVQLMARTGEMVTASLDDHITKWQINDFPPQILETPGPARRFHPTAEMGNGERQFARKCSVCHTLVEDGAHRAGPSLYGLFGRKAGTLAGYNYSSALISSDIVWDEASIHRLFSDGPDVVTPGTKMPIQRMKNEQDRKDLIDYLKTATKAE